MFGVSFTSVALVSPALASRIQSWIGFYIVVGSLMASLVVVLVLAYRTSHQSWGITKTQVVLYRRSGNVRNAYRKWLRERGALSSGSTPLPSYERVHPVLTSSAPPLAGRGDLSWMSDLQGAHELSLEEGFRPRGAIPGYPGKYWRVSDGTGKEVVVMALDNVASKTWVLQRTELELCAIHRQHWALFRHGRRVGSFVEEIVSDDGLGAARVSRAFFDTRGTEVVRVTGAHHTYPTTEAMLLEAFRSGEVWTSDSSAGPVFRVAPDVGEALISLCDSTGRGLATAQKRKNQWHVVVEPGARTDLAALGFLALLSWNPDGVSFGMLRLLELRPDLATKLTAT